MKVKSVTKVGAKPVYDISVEDAEHYVLENGAVTHNTGGMYSADNVFIIGKRQIKEGTTVVGWQFILNAEKSRFIKEKSAIPFEVTYDGGIDRYSGLLDIALITGHVESPKKGYYQRPSVTDDKNWRRKQTSTAEFWDPILEDPAFHDAVSKLYGLGGGKLFDEALAAQMNDTSEDVDLSESE